MPYLIERTDIALPHPREYLSLQLGRNFGAPQGAFTKRREEATVFETREGANRALANLGPVSVMCVAREVAAVGPLPPEIGGFPSAIVADVSNKL